MTTPDIEPAAGTGGAAHSLDLRPDRVDALAEVYGAAATAYRAYAPPDEQTEEAAHHAGLSAIAEALSAPDAPAPSAVPERAAGGGGLPGVDLGPGLREALRVVVEMNAGGVTSLDIEDELRSVVARLAQPRRGRGS